MAVSSNTSWFYNVINNNECKAARCWCLVSSKWRFLGQLAYALQTVDNLVLAGGTLAGTCNRLMLSQHKIEVHQQLYSHVT